MIQNKIERRVDYKAVFSGQVKLEIVGINPTKEEIIKIKSLENIADQVNDPVYTGIDLNENKKNMTKVSFFFKFNPNKQVKNISGTPYPEDQIVNYDIFISDRPVVSKDGTKIQVIDQHNQNAYILKDDTLSPAEMVKAHMKSLEDNGQSKSYVYQKLSELDLNSVRHAYEGETLLYDMMFQLSTLPRHKPEKPLNKFVLSTPGTKYEDISVKPEDVKKEFLKVFNGDVSYIKSVVDNEVCKNADGSQVLVWGMLGASESNGKYYQDILSSPIHCCVNTATGLPPTKIFSNGEAVDVYLSNDTIKILDNKEYPWKSHWDGYELTKFDESSVNHTNSVNGVDSDDEDDDLPF